LATSLAEHDRVTRDLTGVLVSILDRFDRRWHELLDGQHEPLLAAYRERCFLTERTVTLEQPGGKQILGKCQGIDETGRLILQTSNGPARIASGTVVSWEP
jgi:biotin-(acetyl-CoA carboxylase) ligase